ncbi:MAG: TolC family protein [Calditrichales bacterium]|nr:MAG: TolC family protein [Calditrichales bacterium]
MIKILFILTIISGALFGQDLMTAEDAIRLGLMNNFDIRIARNNREIADNNRSKSVSGFLPSLDVNGNYQEAKSNQSTNSPFSFENSTTSSRAAEVSLNWTLFDGFSMFVIHNQYEQLAQLGEYLTRNSIESTVVAILRAYYNLVQQEQLLGVAQNALEISKSRFEKEKVRQDLGSASSTDFWNAQVSYNNDQATLINQELRTLVAQKDLNILLGQKPDTPIQVIKQIIIPDQGLAKEDILDLALKQNSRIHIMLQNKKVADNNVSLNESVFYPRLALRAVYGYSERNTDSDSPRFTEPIETLSRDGNIGLNLSFNLFNGLRDKINWQNARLEAKNRELALDDERNRVAGLVSEKLDTFRKRKSLVELEAQNVNAAERNLQLNQDRYNIGAASSLEFRDAQVNLIRSQTTLIVARYQARITWLELEQLMGNWKIPE